MSADAEIVRALSEAKSFIREDLAEIRRRDAKFLSSLATRG
jgi:hypothetical protein